MHRPDIIRMISSREMRWKEYVAHMREMNCIQRFGMKTRRREVPWKTRHSQEYDIKMCVKEIGCYYEDWNNLAQNGDKWQALVNSIVNLWVP
jgi:hypothetical protein